MAVIGFIGAIRKRGKPVSLFEKAAAALTPMEGQDDRADARAKARSVARQGDILSLILDHHVQLEAAFDAVKSGRDALSRTDALKSLGVLLTGHAIAEEAAIYPAMAQSGEKAHAEHAYTEQATVKMQMAELEKLDPMGRPFLDKLEAIREAVAHHMYEEEGTWFPELIDATSSADQAVMKDHYAEAFDRFVGEESTLATA